MEQKITEKSPDWLKITSGHTSKPNYGGLGGFRTKKIRSKMIR